MKKRILAIVLSTAMALSMVACGGAPTEEAPAATETSAETAEEAPAEEVAAEEAAGGSYSFQVLVKSFQSSYWQAAVKGIDQAAEELGVTAETKGPDKESNVADQLQMFKDAVEKKPDGIGLAACDTTAILEVLPLAAEAGIPVVCFDTSIPEAEEGQVKATVATDNIAAGAEAAINMYPVIAEKIAAASPSAQVRIGELNQDATAANIIERGLGFIDKMIELAGADGKKVAVVGNELYVGKATGAVAEAEADVIIEVAVPAETTPEATAPEASKILSKSDTIAIFASNETTANGLLTANDQLNVLNADPAKGIVAAGFDAGTRQKTAVMDGVFVGSVTQSPLMQGYEMIYVLKAICDGEEVADVPMNGYWYNTDNMNDDNIAPNLYD